LIRTFGDSVNKYLELKNPLSPDRAYLRKNLVYSLAECAIENAKNFDELSIFEISKVFQKKEKSVDESRKIAFSCLDGDSFFEAKGLVEALFSYLNINNYSFDELDDKELSYIHPKKATKISINGKNAGFLGELHPEVMSKYDIKKTVTVCEIDFDITLKGISERLYKPYSKFPSVLIDLAIVVDEVIPEKNIRDLIVKETHDLFDSIELFDIYRGEQIKTGEKSLAYHISLRSQEKTLTEEDIEPVKNKILSKLKKEFNANLRG
ncbi:hypothetical protein HGB13_03850, partial [bacterium]|nr:hypothetical protein [bacterium]